ncbi:MAG TPA: cytochrome P450 [Chloroflexota bacterium]
MKLTGEMGAFRRDPLGMLQRVAREQGDFAPIRFGLSRAVIVSQPALVEEVLVTRNQWFRKNPGTRRLGSLLGHGLLSSDGEAWRRQRRLTQPAFHRARVNAASEVIVDYTLRQAATWQPGDVRDIHQEMMELTLQIACKTLFGAEVAADLAVVREATTVVGAHFLSRLTSLLFMLPDWVPTPGNRRYMRAIQQLDELVHRIIRQRGTSGTSGNDLLSMLLESEMTDVEVRDEVMTFFMAGHETTALALTWALYLLALDRDATARVTHEVDTVLEGRAPTLDDVPSLAYARAVVDEALRMYPPAYMMGRQALIDCEIGGHSVKRGTTLLMSQWLIHHDARFFDDPWAFRPERWLEAKALPRFAYFPFGGGQRQCIGNAFAQLEAVLVLASLLQRCSFEVAPNQRIEPQALITLRPKFGLRMVVGARRAAALPAAAR